MTQDLSLPKWFVRNTIRLATEKRQFTVAMISETERHSMLDEARRLEREKGLSFREIRHEAIADRTLRSHFLPIFEQAGGCILHGCSPVDLVGDRQCEGFTVVGHDLGWEIRRQESSRGFPFWVLNAAPPGTWGFLLSIPYKSGVPLLETLLERSFNPIAVTNPGAGARAAYTFAKNNSRDGRIWLDFEVDMMRINVTASSANVQQLCEMAFRISRIAAPYYNLNFPTEEAASEDNGMEKPLRPPPRKYRYTGGRIPSLVAVERYANWMPALDEEGESGQDETTIRPDDEQRFIGPFTIYTAADAQLADGRTLLALFGQPDATFLHKGEVDVIVVYDGRRRWRVSTCDHDHSWEPAEEGPTKKHGDTRAFPMRVRSRLPLSQSLAGRRIERILYPDGRMETPTA